MIGGGGVRFGQPHSANSSSWFPDGWWDVTDASMFMVVSPIVGNLLLIIPRSSHPFLLKGIINWKINFWGYC